MPIDVYYGAGGSGKSHSMIAMRLLPAVMQGRRVVTNIAGIDPEKILQYCIAKGADPSKVGSVVKFGKNTATAPNFWGKVIHPDDDEGEVIYDDSQSFIKGGDLILIDEVHQIWPPKGQLSKDMFDFLPVHRHFADPVTLVSCDLVVASQSFRLIHGDFVAQADHIYHFLSHDVIGSESSYTRTHKRLQGSRLKDVGKPEPMKYDKEVFSLYKSSNIEGAKKAKDKSKNILSSGYFRFGIVAVPILLIVCFYYIWHFFSAGGLVKEQVKVSPVSGHSQLVNGKAPPPVVPSGGSADWRIAGIVKGKSGVWVVLQGKGSYLRLMPSANFLFVDGRPVSGTVDGEKVTFFSSGAPSLSVR
jgi:zona occludens toxin